MCPKPEQNAEAKKTVVMKELIDYYDVAILPGICSFARLIKISLAQKKSKWRAKHVFLF